VISGGHGSLKASPTGGCADFDRPCRSQPKVSVRRADRWQSCEVTESANQPETSVDDGDHRSTDVLIARIAADRRAGRDTSKDVEALIEIAARENRAALN
jgi:hypothetical protein